MIAIIAILLLLFLMFWFKKTTLVYVFNANCGHCVEFNPIWNEIVKKYPNSEKIPAAKENAPYTPYIYKKTTYGFLPVKTVYSGPRTEKDILDWLK